MSYRDSMYFALLEVHAGRPAAVELRFKGNEGGLIDLSRTVTRVQKGEDGCLHPTFTFDFDTSLNCFTEPMTPPERLLIFGAGPVAPALSEMALRIGLSVTVVDPEEGYLTGRFDNRVSLMAKNFDAAIPELAVTSYDYAVVMTRGHVNDRDCMALLTKGREPAYLGAVGNSNRGKMLKEWLLSEKVDPERVERICAPIGLRIGGATPEEIAVSIMAELIEHRRKIFLPQRIPNLSDADLSVAETLLYLQEPVALVTVLETEGAALCGAGRTMAVFKDGRIVGSIGGGPLQDAVAEEAKNMIGQAKFKVYHYQLEDLKDFHGDSVGGTIQLLVEDIPLDYYDD